MLSLVILAIACACCVAQVVLAVARTTPTKPDNLGPITQHFPYTIDSVHSAVTHALSTGRGLQLRASSPTELVVDVRPNLLRLDDGMGLFTTIKLAADSNGTTWQVTGQPKSWFVFNATARNGLVEFERGLRNDLRAMGYTPTIS